MIGTNEHPRQLGEASVIAPCCLGGTMLIVVLSAQHKQGSFACLQILLPESLSDQTAAQIFVSSSLCVLHGLTLTAVVPQ